jgi:uncharacterized protein DUF222
MTVSPAPFPGSWDEDPVDVAALDDPYCGPPDGDEAWLADVPAEVAAGYLDARPGPPPAPEALAAGFTHRDRSRGARGFAGGGSLDLMEPGPALAGFTANAFDDGLAALTDDELIGVLGAARRLSSWTASLEIGAVSQLDRRRAAAAAATRDSRQVDHVSDEIAAALTLTGRAASRLLDLAAGITRLPAAAAALAAGRIDLPRARVLADELAGLDQLTAAAAAAALASDAAGLTTGQLRDAARRLVLAIDPDAARKRREKAQKSARVECWADPSGAWSLAGRDLPPADVLAADQSIDAAARDLKAAGAEGTLEYLRSRVFLARLSERSLSALLPGQDHDRRNPANGQDGDPGGDGHDQDGEGPGERGPSGGSRPGPAGQHGGPRPGTGAGLTGTVNLTVPLTTWLGLTGQPGEAAGYGPLDAAACRDLAAAIAAAPGSRWCLTITSPAGAALGHGCAKPGHPPPPRGPAPPEGTAPGGTGPPGNHAGPGSTGLPGSTGPPGGAGQIRWLAGIKINWLETGACGHARETFAYQPSPSLRHLVKTRDRTCSFPGCRRPAVRCDDDHTHPFDQGGRTCECNLSPLCRRHHAAKQAPGWHLQQPQPGTLIWTLPSCRTYTTGPGRYPL